MIRHRMRGPSPTGRDQGPNLRQPLNNWGSISQCQVLRRVLRQALRRVLSRGLRRRRRILRIQSLPRLLRRVLLRSPRGHGPNDSITEVPNLRCIKPPLLDGRRGMQRAQREHRHRLHRRSHACRNSQVVSPGLWGPCHKSRVLELSMNRNRRSTRHRHQQNCQCRWHLHKTVTNQRQT